MGDDLVCVFSLVIPWAFLGFESSTAGDGIYVGDGRYVGDANCGGENCARVGEVL
jgi:hypothetical protein